MNKLIICLIITLAIRSGNFTMLMGGPMPRPLTPEVQLKAWDILKAVTGDKLTSGSFSPHLVYYATQVVNGTNYNMVYELDSNQGKEYYCIVAYEKLPVYGGEKSLTSFEKSSDLTDACKTCHAVGHAETICETKSTEYIHSGIKI